MLDEVKTQTVSEPEPAKEGELPEAFTKALDAMDAAKVETKEVETETKKDETAESVSQIPAKEGEEITAEGAVETPPEEELSAEDAEMIGSIDPEVLDAMYEWGWNDEKIIQELKENPQRADDIREALDEIEVEKTRKIETPAKEPETVKERQIEELKLSLDPDIVGQDVKTAIDRIVETLNVSRKEAQELRKELLAEKEKIKAQSDALYDERVNKCFDRFTKQIPALGRAANLSRYNDKIRKELYQRAAVESEIRRIPIERAIEEEIRIYPYRHQKPHEVKKQVRQEVLNDLNKQERRITNAPTRSPSKTVQRQFASSAEEAEYKVREVDNKYA